MKHSECATVPIPFYWGASAGLEMSSVPPEESGTGTCLGARGLEGEARSHPWPTWL